MRIRLLFYLLSVMATFSVAFSAQPTYTPSSETENEYKPFVEPGKTWRYKLVDDYDGIPEDPDPLPDDVLNISIGNAVELEGEEWYPMYIQQQGLSQTANPEPEGYIKEDVNEKKVYWKTNINAPSNYYVKIILPKSTLLYDFNNPKNPDAVEEPSYFDPGWIEAEGVRYNGYVDKYFVCVERLGLVERLDIESVGQSTIFGVIPMVTGMTVHEYVPYIYEVVDGEGNILYQRPENRPTNLLNDGLMDDISIRVVEDKVEFTGAPGCLITMTNMQGIMVWNGYTDSTGHAVSTSLPKGAYVAKHGSRTRKVIVN